MNKSCALVALALLAMLAGCESDSVAPHDPLPELNANDAATQSAAVATTIGEIAIGVLDTDRLKVADYYTIDPADNSPFSGTVWMEFLDAEGGSDVAPQAAGWAHVFTEPEAPVIFETPFGGVTEFHLDYAADIDRTAIPSTGVINGGGTMGSGDYELTYSITNLTVEDDGNPATDDFPHIGVIDVTTQGHTVEVNFDTGDPNTAHMYVDSSTAYRVTLSSGEFEDIPF